MKLPPRLDGHSSEYFKWREQRLERLTDAEQTTSRSATIGIGVSYDADGWNFDAPTLRKIGQRTRAHGFAHYRIAAETDPDRARSQVAALAYTLGLRRSDQGVIAGPDSLTLLEQRSDPEFARFPPYSNKTLNWHTDGYYNAPEHVVRAFLLHCLQPADEGGELTLLDPEVLLIAVYQRDATIVDYLSAPDAITLPGNEDQIGHRRPDRSVPVFFVHNDGTLGMRFTTRSRNIRFKCAETMAAVRRVSEVIESIPQYHSRLRLMQHEGIVSRNILHYRSSYNDSRRPTGRQMLRGRYLDLPTGDAPPI